MAELLLITPQEISQTTVMGGNVDVDKYRPSIANVQLLVLEPLLGSELYKKIKIDFENSVVNGVLQTNLDLTGLYLELYIDYIKPILKNQTAGKYILNCSYTVDNGGIYTHQAENEVVPSRKEIEIFANDYFGMAQTYITRFYDWICKNPLPEYKRHQDGIDAQKEMNLMAGFYFGTAQDLDKWGRYSGINECNNNCKNDLDGCCN